MLHMFSHCYCLKDIDVSNFYIDANTDIKYMFSQCPFELREKIKKQNKKIKAEAFRN